MKIYSFEFTDVQNKYFTKKFKEMNFLGVDLPKVKGSDMLIRLDPKFLPEEERITGDLEFQNPTFYNHVVDLGRDYGVGVDKFNLNASLSRGNVNIFIVDIDIRFYYLVGYHFGYEQDGNMFPDNGTCFKELHFGRRIGMFQFDLIENNQQNVIQFMDIVVYNRLQRKTEYYRIKQIGDRIICKEISHFLEKDDPVVWNEWIEYTTSNLESIRRNRFALKYKYCPSSVIVYASSMGRFFENRKHNILIPIEDRHLYDEKYIWSEIKLNIPDRVKCITFSNVEETFDMESIKNAINRIPNITLFEGGRYGTVEVI